MNTQSTNGSSAVSGWTPQMEERKQPKKFEFGIGVELVGILTGLQRVMVRDKRSNQPKAVNRYTLQPTADGTATPEGDPVFFFGTIQLDDALKPKDVGHVVCIQCTGEDKEAGRNGNAMKLFRVFVDKNHAPGWANDGTAISDADLPDDSFVA